MSEPRPRVLLRQQQDFQFEIDFGEGKPRLLGDEGPPLGQGAGPTPVQLLAAAVGNCMADSLLFALPGTPIIYYGDELGMGDNIYLGDRNGVRTPMQWSSDRNAGFSRADPARLYAPPIMDPVYGYEAINVEAQERYPFSLLNWMKRLVAMRRQHPVLGRGALEFIPCSNRKILVYLRRDERETILCVVNLARTVQPAELDLKAFAGLIPVEMFGLTEFPRIGDLPYFLTLGGYASYWFTLRPEPMNVAPRAASCRAIANSTPAFAVPSSFVMTRPVSPTAASNSFTCDSAF